MKIGLLLAAISPAFSGASSFHPRISNGYLPYGARTNLSISTQVATDINQCENALSFRGGDGDVNSDIPKTDALAGAAFFTALQVVMNKIFVANKITFPAMLGGTVLVFAVLVLAEATSPGMGENAFQILTPGTNLLNKWLPVMFVPGLAMLPLAPSIGSAGDILKVLSVVVFGFAFSMASTAYLVLGMRSAQGLVEGDVEEPLKSPKKSVATETLPPSPKPFTEGTYNFLLQGTLLGGAVSMAATRLGTGYATPLRTIFMLFGTVFTYVFGARLPSDFTKIVHPLVTSTAGTLLLTKLDALVTGSSFDDVLKSYKAGSLSPSKTGAGDLLLFLLGPAVGCLSIPMYGRKKMMADNLLVVVAAMFCSSAGGLFSTAWFVRVLSIGSNAMVRMSLLARNVTTALAIVITQILEGNIAIAASVVCLGGIFGATVGRGMLDSMKISDPVSRGLGMGGAGQGLGVAAIMPENEAFPFAAINMVLTATCSTALVSIPSVKKLLVDIATGGVSTVSE